MTYLTTEEEEEVVEEEEEGDPGRTESQQSSMAPTEIPRSALPCVRLSRLSNVHMPQWPF